MEIPLSLFQTTESPRTKPLTERRERLMKARDIFGNFWSGFLDPNTSICIGANRKYWVWHDTFWLTAGNSCINHSNLTKAPESWTPWSENKVYLGSIYLVLRVQRGGIKRAFWAKNVKLCLHTAFSRKLHQFWITYYACKNVCWFVPFLLLWSGQV